MRSKRFRALILSLITSMLLVGCKTKQASSLPISPVSFEKTKVESVSSRANSGEIAKFCEDLNQSVAKYNWKFATCDSIAWKTDLERSTEGRLLVYAEFGSPKSKNTTLVLTMVHPDEITPLYLGFKLVHWLKDHETELKDSHVVIAPLVNPDGYFRAKPIRMNARGVDLNRNFATKDWKDKALQAWRGPLHSNPRRFPGNEPSSETETHFQEDLIKKFRPQKILSIHAPLNVMDYDGPSSLTLDRFPKEYVQECLTLRSRLKATTTGYFPGSLGNYTGQELGIPTVTLELPSADHRQADGYWLKFHEGIRTMIEYQIENGEVARLPPYRPNSAFRP